MKKIILASMLMLAGALLSACGGGSSSSTGTARIYLTDAPSCGYDHVYVTVDHIDFSSDDGTSWTSVPVDASVGRIDLLDLQNGIMQQLAETPLAAGTYNQVRLVLQANGNASPWANSIVLSGSGTETPLSTPSAQQSGYKIVGPFTVQPGTQADLYIDFNACKSVVIAGKSGKYNLKPVVRAVAEVVSGSITGTTTPGAAVYAEQNGQEITGTIADTTTGNFTLSPLVQSSTGGNIDVVIVPPTDASMETAIIQNVPVTAGSATSIGSITPAATTLHMVSGTVTTTTGHDANMTVTQTISASASTYLIAMGPTDTSTGTYSFLLASTGPEVGTYASPPISLTEDTDTADVGQYTVTATDADNGTSSLPVDVSIGDASGVDFTLSP